mmetsp:Transcript_40/g.62  ORF Transcript_40/g.62 Transcript_40/m.62 type:complete len:472 (-) Transcript_40:232-1647(-)
MSSKQVITNRLRLFVLQRPQLLLLKSPVERIGSVRKRCFSDKANLGSKAEQGLAGKHKTPMVDYLWDLRTTARKQEEQRRQKETEKALAHRAMEATSAQMKGKSPSESFTQITYPFSTDSLFREKYINPWGTIRVGRIVEDLDALAGTIAFRHSKHSSEVNEECILVTASIDRIILGHRPNLNDDIDLSGKVSWVGTSSMEINMTANSSWTTEPWLSALFSFVALDKNTGKPAALNRLIPETDEEKVRFGLGEERNQTRKRQRQEKSKARIQKRRKGVQGEHDHADDDEEVSLETAAQLLFNEARPFLDLPALAPRNIIRLSDTVTENAMIMQPQQRNTAGRIFGGFLVRRAYELAYASAYMFGGHVPRFRELDEVVFKKPVDVGDLVRFRAFVLYTSTHMHDLPTAHIQVDAFVTKPENMSSTLSNTFNFTFEFPAETLLRDIVPESLEEAITIVTRFQNDLIQKEEDET